jgi:ABC-type polysaccharide/polyol phosphate export permease
MEITPALFSIIPAILILLLAAPAVAVLFGLAGAYFPDFQFIVVNAVRLLMFITPIFWTYHGLGGLLGFLYYWNPLTHYIDIIRTPIVEGVLPINSWVVVLSVTGGLLAAALLALGKFNRQIVFQI